MDLSKILKWLVAVVVILVVSSIILRGLFNYTNILIALIISFTMNILLVRYIITSKRKVDKTEEPTIP